MKKTITSLALAISLSGLASAQTVPATEIMEVISITKESGSQYEPGGLSGDKIATSANGVNANLQNTKGANFGHIITDNTYTGFSGPNHTSDVVAALETSDKVMMNPAQIPVLVFNQDIDTLDIYMRNFNGEGEGYFAVSATQPGSGYSQEVVSGDLVQVQGGYWKSPSGEGGVLRLTNTGANRFTFTGTGQFDMAYVANPSLTENVPEPSSTFLLGLGGIGFILRRKR